jgi:hypothetical protein
MRQDGSVEADRNVGRIRINKREGRHDYSTGCQSSKAAGGAACFYNQTQTTILDAGRFSAQTYPPIPMSWKGTFRAMEAAQRRQQRDAQKRQRELERQDKERVKLSAIEQARLEVEI